MNSIEIELLPRWEDLPRDIKVRVYPLPEIAGEKLRCIMQRMQCRDLFDLYILFEDAGVDPRDAMDVFVPKAKHKEIDPERFESSYRARLTQYRRRWENELEIHVPGDVPHYAQVERVVSRHLRAAGLL